MKAFSNGVLHAFVALPMQVGLVRVLEFVPNGTRAQAVGACIATLALMLSGFLLGARARSAGESVGKMRSRTERDRTVLALVYESAAEVPWLAIASAGACLAALGALAFFMSLEGVAVPFVPESALGAGGIARAVFATDAIGLPALAILSIGALLGVHARPWATLTSLVAFGGLVGLSAAGGHAARYASYDPAIIRLYTLTGAIAAALVTGFLVSWIRRRLAFVEQCLVALLAGYTIYFLAAVGPKELIQASNVPEEQILLALVLGPTMGYLCMLTVGGSLGFLLLGGGRLDAGFRYETGIALRYIRSTRSDRFIGKVTVISVLGVCIGVMALIVVLSVMSGFEDDLKRKILGAHAHIVLGKHGDDFVEYKEVEERVRAVSGVATAAAFVLGDGMISSDAGLSGTLVKGIDPREMTATAELRANCEKGSLDHLLTPELIPGARPRVFVGSSTAARTRSSTVVPNAREPEDFARPALREPVEAAVSRVLPGIVIGRELSRTLRAYVGDTVKLVSPVSEDIGPTGPQPKLRRFRVACIFYSGMYEYDAKFTYIDIGQAQTFFGKRDRATGVELKVQDVDDTSRIVEELKRRVGGYPYTVKDWRAMNKELFSALLLEKLAMFIILTFIILVASFNIVATLVMIVLEKGKEIAIMKSLGASDASIMKIFVVQGLIVGIGGAFLGLVGGIAICAFIAKFGIKLDQKIFYIERLPVVMDWGEITAIAIAAVMISYLATIYPAITAASLRPVEGLRDD